MSNRRKTSWERATAVFLFITLIFLLIAYVALRLTMFSGIVIENDVLAILRFLAAISAGFAAFLMPGKIELDIKKLGIRAAGGIALFIIVFFWFFSRISESETNEPISYQYITAANAYPTYSAFDRDNPYFPTEIAEVLGIEGRPLINDDNPVYESFNAFKAESLYPDLTESLSNEYQTLPKLVEINARGKTSRNIPRGDVEVKRQTQENFMKTSLGSFIYGSYADVEAPISLEDEDGPYTKILPNIQDCTYFSGEGADDGLRKSGTITQFPTARHILKYLEPTEGKPQNLWMRKVLENNPESRGIASFTYAFRNSEDISFPLLDPHFFVTVRSDFLEPYIRFIDVKNISTEPVRIEELRFKSISSPFKLTKLNSQSVRERRNLFKQEQVQVKPLGILLESEKHLFLPIEFGLREPQAYKLDYSEACSRQIAAQVRGQRNKTLAVTKPIPEEFQQEMMRNRLAYLRGGVGDFPGDDSEKEALLDVVRDRIILPPSFFENSDILETPLSNVILAIGAVLDPVEIKISGKLYKLNSPLLRASTTINPYLQSGSCPYVRILDSKTNVWRYVGKALVNRDSPEMSGQDIYNLGSRVKSIRLEELEREKTFISSIAVEALYETESFYKEILSRDFSRQNEASLNGYKILEVGDFLEVDLGNIDYSGIKNIRLKVSGFFLEDEMDT